MHERHGRSAKDLVDRQVFLWREEARTHGHASEVPSHGPRAEVLGPYIAISRDYGCQAVDLAKAVGERLTWTVYDRELIDEVAREAHLRRSVVESFDEQTRTWIAEYIGNLTFAAVPTEHDFFNHLVNVVTSIARHGKAILVGRGANFILPPAHGLRVRLIAPFDYRVRLTETKHRLTRAEAEQLVRVRDAERLEYIRHHFGKSIEDPSSYDTLYNLADVTPDTVIESIVATARSKLRLETAAAR
ncbi:MAG: cytidylate kinase-like family protein [Candidatus Riflebacteria bacterium]|nr:cytidylate kinase-like family protein [Candidatus Riflebacteria bacterium]